MRRLKKASRLSPAQLWVLAQAALCMPTVRVALRFISVARLNAMTTRSRRQLSRIDAKPEDIARLVSIAAHHGIYRAKCLEKSLVLRWLLLRRGIDARVCLGARKTEQEVEAHAWVEVDGLSLDEHASAFFPFQDRH